MMFTITTTINNYYCHYYYADCADLGTCLPDHLGMPLLPSSFFRPPTFVGYNSRTQDLV